MGLIAFLFGKQSSQPHGRVEDMDDYSKNPPDNHWTVDQEVEEDRDDDGTHSEDTYVLMIYRNEKDEEARCYTPVNDFNQFFHLCADLRHLVFGIGIEEYLTQQAVVLA